MRAIKSLIFLDLFERQSYSCVKFTKVLKKDLTCALSCHWCVRVKCSGAVIMLKLFLANQCSLLVLTLSSFLQLVCYNDSVIDWSIIGNTTDVGNTNSHMDFTSDINTSDDNKTITVTSKIDYMTIKCDIFNQDNNHMDDILLYMGIVFSSLSRLDLYICYCHPAQHLRSLFGIKW